MWRSNSTWVSSRHHLTDITLIHTKINEMRGATGHLLVPVGPCGSSQCHVSLDRPDHGRPVSCLYSSQMWHHCLWPTATTENKKGGANYCEDRCRGGWSYLPGHMPHGHVMLLHAGLTAVVWRVSYLIGGGGSTVYPPLGRAEHGEQ